MDTQHDHRQPSESPEAPEQPTLNGAVGAAAPESPEWNRVAQSQWALFTRIVIAEFFSNNCPYMAAGIAYWTFFSIFPLALAAASILGFINSTAAEQQQMVGRIIDQIPVSADYVLELVESVADARGALSAVAIVGLLVSGSVVFTAVRKTINHAWHVTRPHPFFVARGIDLLMLLFLALYAVIPATNFVGIVASGASNLWFVNNTLINVGIEIAFFVASIGVLAVLYRFVPNTRVQWRDVWLGAVVGADIAYLVRLAFSGVLVSVSEFNLVYGSLGALVALMAWIYFTAFALVLGAEVSYIYSRAFGSRRFTNAFAVLQARYSLGRNPFSHRNVARQVATLMDPWTATGALARRSSAWARRSSAWALRTGAPRRDDSDDGA